MKTFFILLFSITLFASSSNVALNYELLNKEIDAISHKLSPEEKVSLYFLILSTQEKLTKSLAIDEIKAATLEVFSKLHKTNTQISADEIERLRTLYIEMSESSPLIQTQTVKIQNTSLLMPILSALLTFFAGIILGYFIFRNKESEELSVSYEDILKEVKNQNLLLSKEIDDLKNEKNEFQDSNYKATLDVQSKSNAVKKENSAFKKELSTLENSHKVALQKSELEIQHLNEYVESLRNELAKYERSSSNIQELSFE